MIGIAYEYQNLETQGPSLPTVEAVVQEGTVFTTVTTTTIERDGPTRATDVRSVMSTCTCEVLITSNQKFALPHDLRHFGHLMRLAGIASRESIQIPEAI